MLPILLASIQPAAAQGTPVFPIATNPAVMELGNALAFDGTNCLVGLFAGTNLSVQLVAGNGALLGSQIILSGSGSSALAMGGARFAGTNYLVAWSDTSIVSNVDMFGQFISRAGAKVGSPFHLLQTLGAHGAQIARALATDGTNYLFVWMDSSGGAYYGQLVTQAGALSGSEFLISGQSLNGNSAAVAFGKTNYLVVWQSDNGVSANVQAWGELVSPAGVAGSLFQIGVAASADEKLVDGMGVAFDGTNYLVVWTWNPGPQTSGTLTNWQIYGRLVSPSGSFPGSELILTSGRNQALPALAFDGADYLLAYGYDSNTTNSDANLYFQFLDRSAGFAGPVFAPLAPQGVNIPLLPVNGVLFDGSRYVVAASFGALSESNSDVYGAFLPSSAAAPVLAAGHRSGTQFPLQLTGTPGINYAIQVSTNLVLTNWAALATNSPTNGTFAFTDTNATNKNAFYRAVKQ